MDELSSILAKTKDEFIQREQDEVNAFIGVMQKVICFPYFLIDSLAAIYIHSTDSRETDSLAVSIGI